MALFRDILLVDDDPLVMMNYLELFEEAGYNVIGADSLAQAWRELSLRDFDLIVSDHDLGDGKGITLVRRIADSGRNIPVVYLSAALPSILNEIATIPAIRKVLTKPVIPAALLATVRELLPAKAPERQSGYPQTIGREERDAIFKLFDADEPQEQS